MRKFKLLALFSLCALCNSIVSAQIKQEAAPRIRCGTEIAFEEQLRTNPAFKVAYERKVAEAANATSTNQNSRLSALTGPVTIPVVVHVVLPNPEIITEEQIDYLLNRLNLDFSGLNPDSTNGVIFYPVRGHSLIRFTRARRTPGGLITNGLERRVGSTQILGTTYQPIKHTSDGGLDPWDVTQYYNIWVGGSAAVLGIAPGIGVGNQTETTGSATGIDGVCVNAASFSNGCFSDPSFSLGRTTVHEIGHNFGLYHTFQGGCAVAGDFGQPTPAGQTLPASLIGTTGDDTPAQAAPTAGCPTGTVATGCAISPNPPGKMYQNYMDYTDDPCYSMFTKSQVGRMEYMLETYRPGYLTTQGANPPAGYPALDAGLDGIVSPGGAIFNNAACTIARFPTPSCPGAFIPRVSVTNYGATTITSVIATVSVGGVTSAAITFPVNLITNRSAVLSFPTQNLVLGANNISFTIVSVNGSPDTYATNNTISTVITVAQSALPFAQDFVTTTFPPPNMSIFNPDGNFTWERRAVGNVTAGSAFINNYANNNPDQIDELRTLPLAPPVGASNGDSLIIAFDVANKFYAGSFDTLSVLVSTNCGVSFTRVFVKTGPALATAPGTGGPAYTAPLATEWRRERISLPGTFLTGGPIIVAFRNTNDYGNNTFLDNINVDALIVLRRDLQLVSINQPGPVTCTNIIPSVTVRNRGSDTITAFKVNHVINTGTPVVTNITGVSIVPNASLTVPLTGATFPAPGTYTFRAYTYEPVSTSGNTDQNRSNDTLVKTVQVVGTQAAPLAQGFEDPTFPPAGWAINNPDAGLTWQRILNVARTGVASARINNYNYANAGARDELYSPQVTYNNIGTTPIDSLSVAFDVAAITYSYPGSTAIPLDTLEVFATSDCGTTLTSIYKKWGNELQTVNDPNFSQTLEFVPNGRNQWRREQINLTAFANRSSIQLIFRNTNNFENNIYLDNIDLTTKTLPAKLKQDGYLIYPSPFSSTFAIQHYLSPTELRGVAVYNSIGQRVYAQTYGAGGASALIQVDMSRYASGLYTVVLRYTNRTISQKVIKQP